MGGGEVGEEEYLAMAAYCGEHPEDIAFPKGAKVKVVKKSSSGWWLVK